MSSHSGEVALLGGKTEDGDANDIQTALSEAEEDIGLDPSLVDVVAILEPFVNKRGITIVTVIGILANQKAFHPVPNAAEVEAIFDAPLEMFLKDENRRAEVLESEGKIYLLHFFDYEGENNKADALLLAPQSPVQILALTQLKEACSSWSVVFEKLRTRVACENNHVT